MAAAFPGSAREPHPNRVLAVPRSRRGVARLDVRFHNGVGLRLPTLAGEAMEPVSARFDNPLHVLAGQHPRVWALFSLGYQRGDRNTPCVR